MTELPGLIERFPCLRWTTDDKQVEFVPYESEQDPLATHAYAAPFLANGLCIVTRRGDGRWTLPGGTIVLAETWREALRREILEETGCIILQHCPFGAFRIQDRESTRFRIVSIAAVERVQTPRDPDGKQGIVAVQEMPVDEAAALFADGLAHYGAVYSIAGLLRAYDRSSD